MQGLATAEVTVVSQAYGHQMEGAEGRPMATAVSRCKRRCNNVPGRRLNNLISVLLFSINVPTPSPISYLRFLLILANLQLVQGITSG